MDTGKMQDGTPVKGIYGKAISKDNVLSHMKGIISTVKKLNPDIILFQEVDIKSNRARGVDEQQMLRDNLPGMLFGQKPQRFFVLGGGKPMISGPSSSGKTTFAFKLCTQLQVRGKKTVKISLDNYYLTPDKCPKDQDGNPDFERLEALNLPLFQQQIQSLQEGEDVLLPRYDFATKTTTFEEKAKIDNRTIVVIEGIHVRTDAIIDDPDFSKRGNTYYFRYDNSGSDVNRGLFVFDLIPPTP